MLAWNEDEVADLIARAFSKIRLAGDASDVDGLILGVRLLSGRVNRRLERAVALFRQFYCAKPNLDNARVE